MKASPRQQQLLLELQELDHEESRLNRRLKQLPERAELEALSGRSQETKDVFMQAQRALEDLQTEIGKIEADVQTVDQRNQRTTERLAASTQSKEANALQDELTTLETRKRVLEDRELELMEQLEEAQTAFEEATTRVNEVEAEAARLRTAIQTAEEEVRELRTSNREDRAGLAAEVQGPILDVYEHTRERYGIGAARLRGRVSEGSNMELDAADYRAALDTPEDELYFCPTSGAILVREPEQAE